MRNAFVISAILGIVVAGATTATVAKTGDQYTLDKGGCLAGDKVNPPGSIFHCTEAMRVNPGTTGARKAAPGSGNASRGSGPARQ